MRDAYWTHNTAYHKWILKHISNSDHVLDVGCGDGLLVQKIAKICNRVTGIEPHLPSALKARERLKNVENANIESVPFEKYSVGANTYDVIIFVASLHHMDLESCLIKAKELLAAEGRLLVVGLSKPEGFVDFSIECLRAVPAKLGSLIHGEKNGGKIGVPVQPPNLSLREICNITDIYLPNAKVHRGLYYRYLLSWVKQITV